MVGDKKSDYFQEIMRRMGQTKQLPIDLQPMNPAVPLQRSFNPVEMRKALSEETGLSEEDLKQLAPGLLDGDEEEKRMSKISTTPKRGS